MAESGIITRGIVNAFEFGNIISGSGAVNVVRNLSYLDSVQGSHLAVVAPITFTGDFEVTMKYSSTVPGDYGIISDTFQTSYHCRFQASNNTFSLWGADASSLNSPTIPELFDGRVHTIGYGLEGTRHYLLFDGVRVSSNTSVAVVNGPNNFLVGNGNTESALPFNGIIYDFVVDNAGDVQTFPVNLTTSGVEYPNENVFGISSWSSINFSGAGDSPWTGTMGDALGSFSIPASGTGPRTQLGTFTDGVSYELTIDITVLGGSPQIWYFDGVSNGQIISTAELSNGPVTVLFSSASDAQIYIRAGSANSAGTLNSISIRSISNAITYENIPDANISRFTLVESAWEEGLQTELSNISAVGTEGAFSILPPSFDGTLIGGATYAYTATFNLSSGEARFRIASYISPPGSGQETREGQVQVTAANRLSFQAFTVPCIGTMGLTYKRIIEIA